MAVSPLWGEPYRGTRAISLAEGVQHDYRDLALGLALVIGVGWPELERLFPQPCPLLTGGGPGPCLHLRGPDLHFDLRVGEDVAVPAGMLRRAAFRRDHKIAVAGLPVEQREDEPLSRLPAGRRQQQRRYCDLRSARLGHLVHVS